MAKSKFLLACVFYKDKSREKFVDYRKIAEWFNDSGVVFDPQ